MPILFRKLPPSICMKIFAENSALDAHRLLDSAASNYMKNDTFTSKRKLENGILSYNGPGAVFNEEDVMVDFELGQKRFSWEEKQEVDPYYSGSCQQHEDSYYGRQPPTILIRKACLLFEKQGNKLELLAQVDFDLRHIMAKYEEYEQLLVVITYAGEERTSDVRSVKLTWLSLSD